MGAGSFAEQIACPGVFGSTKIGVDQARIAKNRSVQIRAASRGVVQMRFVPFTVREIGVIQADALQLDAIPAALHQVSLAEIGCAQGQAFRATVDCPSTQIATAQIETNRAERLQSQAVQRQPRAEGGFAAARRGLFQQRGQSALGDRQPVVVVSVRHLPPFGEESEGFG